MASEGKIFKVDTRPTKQVVVTGLTRDLPARACIFDLIDNSIDAARDSILAAADEEDRHHLPASYEGRMISLTFSGTRFRIVDNCGGITKKHLAEMVLRFGETSEHELGIGVFGVGLNRALFKLGSHSVLKTDTGAERSELVLDVPKYLAKKDDWNVDAREFPTTGKAWTEIEVTNLPVSISSDFADSDSVDKIRQEIATRYGQFISKGLVIKIGDKPVAPHVMEIRQNSPYPGDYKIFRVGEDVSVHLQYGQLKDHRFSNEFGYEKAKNLALTEEFGWTVICNDRVILLADRTFKTGWDSASGFHSEFYGFAGIASFEARDPLHLPWNTMKTDVDLYNPAYQAALGDMRRFAMKWRSTVHQRKKQAKSGEPIGEPPPETSPSPSPPRPGPKPPARPPVTIPTPKPKPPVVKPDHHEYRELLPQDVNELHCVDKLLALVHEGKRVDLYRDPYSSLALFRMLFETAGVEYFRRHGKADEIREFAVAARLKKGHTMTDAQKLQAYPSMDELLAFLLADASVWGSTKSPLRHSLDKVKSYQKQLNGVLHNPFQQVAQHLALDIRNEGTPILRHLIES